MTRKELEEMALVAKRLDELDREIYETHITEVQASVGRFVWNEDAGAWEFHVGIGVDA
jgi:hypothetical protein